MSVLFHFSLYTYMFGYNLILIVYLAPPDEGPRISGGQDRYKPGDTVNVNCTSGRSKPAVHLAWYINGEQVDFAFILIIIY